MNKISFILPCLFLLNQPLKAKVEAPNYDFSVDTLADFSPSSEISSIQKKYGNGEVVNEVNGVKTFKFYVSQTRYKFPVLIQERDGKVLDSFSRLPNYFLHDIFLNSLVKRFGKQSKYKRNGEEAYYVWEKDGQKHIYSAACTITCFPIFYSVHPLKAEDFKNLMDQMRNIK